MEIARGAGVAGNHPLGSTAPDFEAKDLATGQVVSSVRFVGSQTLILFVTPACSTCDKVIQGLAQVRRGELRNDLPDLLVYCDGSKTACLSVRRKHDLAAAFFLGGQETDVPGKFGVRALPALVKLNDRWRIMGYWYPTSSADVLRVIVSHTRR